MEFETVFLKIWLDLLGVRGLAFWAFVVGVLLLVAVCFLSLFSFLTVVISSRRL